MELIPIDPVRRDSEYSRRLSEQLESGNILILNPTPFIPSEQDCVFLREQKQASDASHKNIAYKPHIDKITGAKSVTEESVARMHSILSKYSTGALQYLSETFPHYAQFWRVDYASFRPVEEQGRNLPIRHRNDLMHLDAFPTRPTHGGRILRAFTNIHPDRERVWGTADPFEQLAERYALDAGLKNVIGTIPAARRKFLTLGRLIGVRHPDRSAYDEFMLRFHHYLKSSVEFQQNGQRNTASFPPGSTWISYTDQVAHKALSGQYALEQTCIIPLEAMLHPEKSPVSVLERLAGRKLVTRRQPLARADSTEKVHA